METPHSSEFEGQNLGILNTTLFLLKITNIR